MSETEKEGETGFFSPPSPTFFIPTLRVCDAPRCRIPYADEIPFV